MSYRNVLQPYVNGAQRGRINGEEFSIRCLWHDERTPSLFVNVDHGGFNCKGCGKVGWIDAFVARIENVSVDVAMALIEKRGGNISKYSNSAMSEPLLRNKQKVFFPEAAMQSFDGVHSEMFMNYLSARGISKKTAKYFDLREGAVTDTKWSFRIVYAVRNLEGKIVSIKGRSILEKTARPYNEIDDGFAGEGFFGIKQVQRAKKHPVVYVVEGPFDAMAMWECGFPAVALGSSSLSAKQAQLLRSLCVKPIVIYDGVRTGTKISRNQFEMKARENLAKYFPDYTVTSLPYSDKDPNELLLDRKLKQIVTKITQVSNERQKSKTKSGARKKRKGSLAS